MSRAHVIAFLQDAQRTNHKYKERTSSLQPLTSWLRNNESNPSPSTTDQLFAKAHARVQRDKYKPAIRRLASVWGKGAEYPQPHWEDLFANSYRRSLYWHGVKRGDMDKIYREGLQIKYSCCPPGSSDPGNTPVKGGGPLSLGITRASSLDYCGDYAMLFRIYLPSDWGKHLLMKKIQPNDWGKIKGSHVLYKDFDAAEAAFLVADLAPEYMLRGTLADDILNNPNSNRSNTILDAIASFEPIHLTQDRDSLRTVMWIAMDKKGNGVLTVGNTMEEEHDFKTTLSCKNKDYYVDE